jgi:hypothetical protein
VAALPCDVHSRATGGGTIKSGRRKTSPDDQFVFCSALPLEQVEDVNKRGETAMSPDGDALLQAHVKHRDVVHAARADWFSQNPYAAVVGWRHECAAEGLPGLMPQQRRDSQGPTRDPSFCSSP